MTLRIFSKDIIPKAVTFHFSITPKPTKKHKNGTKFGIIHLSGLSDYFEVSEVKFMTENGKTMMKVFCQKPAVTIKKHEEKKFYKQIESMLSEWVMDTFKINGYECRLENFAVGL